MEEVDEQRRDKKSVQAVIEIQAIPEPCDQEDRNAAQDDREPDFHAPHVVGDQPDTDNATVQDVVGDKEEIDTKGDERASEHDHERFFQQGFHRPSSPFTEQSFYYPMLV